jgi:hypothetical protein
MDLGGRYLKPLSIERPWYFYLDFLLKEWSIPWFSVSVAGILAGLFSDSALLRRTTLYIVLLLAGFIAVLSVSATKFSWYLLPAYPLMALLAGILIYTLLRHILPAPKNRLSALAGLAAILLLFAWPYAAALERSLNPQTERNMAENGTMGYFMKDVLHKRRNIDGRYIAIETYQGDVRWYLRVLKAQGRPVPVIEDRKFVPGQTVIAYQEDVKNFIDARFHTDTVENFRGVLTYRIIRPKS